MNYHPTLLDIANRDMEIQRWDDEAAWCRKHWDRVARITAWVSGVLWLAALTVPGFVATGILVLIALASSCLTVMVFSIRSEPLPELVGRPRPIKLKIVPFTQSENFSLVVNQAPEIFLHCCACPGCGNVSVHKIDAPVYVRWASVIRTCDVCSREWAQR